MAGLTVGVNIGYLNLFTNHCKFICWINQLLVKSFFASFDNFGRYDIILVVYSYFIYPVVSISLHIMLLSSKSKKLWSVDASVGLCTSIYHVKFKRPLLSPIFDPGKSIWLVNEHGWAIVDSNRLVKKEFKKIKNYLPIYLSKTFIELLF